MTLCMTGKQTLLVESRACSLAELAQPPLQLNSSTEKTVKSKNSALAGSTKVLNRTNKNFSCVL